MQSDQSSLLRAFFALVWLTLRRHWRVRTFGWVTFGLVTLMAVAVFVITHVSGGWRLETRSLRIADTNSDGDIGLTYREYALKRAPFYEVLPGPVHHFSMRAIPFGAYSWLMLSDDPVAKNFRDDYALVSFARRVVFTLYLGFVLPLFTLAFASGALGMEREGRTLIWLQTRPMPRPAIYLAKFFGVLPWCIAVSLLSLGILCLAGGELGMRAFQVYWLTAVIGTIGLSALFHLIGALFRRPAIIGLVYVFFFETLVANLPGSLKRLSLNYYIRSLMYNETTQVVQSVVPENLEVYAPVGTEQAYWTIFCATVGLCIVGMTLFSRQEPKDEQ